MEHLKLTSSNSLKGLLILVALIFGIVNTMLMVVLERTKEIAYGDDLCDHKWIMEE